MMSPKKIMDLRPFKNMNVSNNTMLFYLILLLGVPLSLLSAESSCYLDIERNFFTEKIVNQTLASHNISQSNWSLINQALRSNAKEVPRIVRERAKKMNPNPFDTPFRPIIAEKILNQVLFEVFTTTLSTFKINNPNDVADMYLYIRNSHAAKLIECFGKDVLE